MMYDVFRPLKSSVISLFRATVITAIGRAVCDIVADRMGLLIFTHCQTYDHHVRLP